MTRPLVVDSSAICALFFEDEATPDSDRLLQRLAAGDVWVPGLFVWEVANVLLMAERRQRLSQADRVEALQMLESLHLEIDHCDPLVAWKGGLQLAAQTGLTSYDAAYLELAMRIRAPLATRDRELQRCCQAAGVALEPC
ncbi:MAG: type II toxin-antitoxin system VapC family toxin [Vulcanococcus sp.]